MDKKNLKKTLMLGVFASLLLLTGCRDSSSSSSASGESSTEVTESSTIITTEETPESTTGEEDVTSEKSETTETTTESSETTESVETTSSGENNGSSEGNEPVYFIDDDFERDHTYTGYDIEHYVPTSDPYISIQDNYDRDEFYLDNYTRATSYEDAMYRTAHGLISGDIKDTPINYDYDINHLPDRSYRDYANYRIDEGEYEYDQYGNFRSYTINNIEGKTKKIYYGAGYVTLEDVAAYLFAFADAPANVHTNKNASAQRAIIQDWGRYGRVNNGYYSSDTTQYKYEAELPETDNGLGKEDHHLDYFEMDFGFTQTPWGYGVESYEPYNNGSRIERGTVRFVYTGRRQLDGKTGAEHIPVERRHVFLTFNHYNDFIEYLNYENGWGAPFGWMTAGNDYVAGMNASKYGPGYYDFIDPFPQTSYPVPTIKSLAELKAIVNH